MRNLELIDETFDKDRTGVYELSIQACLNGFSFSVKDTIRNTFIVLCSHSFSAPALENNSWSQEISTVATKYAWLTSKFKNVYFSFCDSHFTIVPSEIFEPEKSKILFELTQILPDYSELNYLQIVNNSDFTIIFSIPTILASEWLKIQPDTKIVPPIASLFASPECSKVEHYLQANFSKNQLLLSYHEGGRFIAANRFDFKTSNDAAYYILSFCKGLDVNVAAVNVEISGEYDDFDELVKTLSVYFHQVSKEVHFSSAHFSYLLLRQRSAYYSLFNSSGVCE